VHARTMLSVSFQTLPHHSLLSEKLSCSSYSSCTQQCFPSAQCCMFASCLCARCIISWLGPQHPLSSTSIYTSHSLRISRLSVLFHSCPSMASKDIYNHITMTWSPSSIPLFMQHMVTYLGPGALCIVIMRQSCR
jgi:hypothetical protein